MRALGVVGALQNTVDAVNMIRQGDSTGYAIIGMNLLGAGIAGKLAGSSSLRGGGRQAGALDTNPMPPARPGAKIDPTRRVVDYGIHPVTNQGMWGTGGSQYTMEAIGKRAGIGAGKTVDVSNTEVNRLANVGAQIGPASKGGTYVLRNEMGEVVRSGRTNDFARRQSEHSRDPNLKDFTFDVEHRTDVYAEQRGLEQLLHDTYMPVLNKIRPISPSNPRLPEYLDAAGKYLDAARKYLNGGQ